MIISYKSKKHAIFKYFRHEFKIFQKPNGLFVSFAVLLGIQWVYIIVVLTSVCPSIV